MKERMKDEGNIELEGGDEQSRWGKDMTGWDVSSD